MKTPDIKVQLVHLDGPFKGDIQEFFEPVIVIGRHPDCQLVFPKECTAISRKHAEIRREGNRFKFVDHSANGTLINGKQQKEVFLKDGDVLIVGGMGGPKVSFLSSKVAVGEGGVITSVEGGLKKKVSTTAPQVFNEVRPAKDENQPQSVPLPPSVQKPVVVPLTSVQPQAPAAKSPEPIAAVTKTLIIQYGATLTSFKQLPITIGSGSDCDCIMQHQALLEHHAQIFFRDNQYWVKDLTGRGLLTVNLQQVQSESPLMPDTCLSLTAKGPKFQFLGEGRLAEIDTTEEKREQPLSAKGTQKGTGGSPVQTPKEKNILPWILVIVFIFSLVAAVSYFLPSSFLANLLDSSVFNLFKTGGPPTG